jgi:hypothetical protein
LLSSFFFLGFVVFLALGFFFFKTFLGFLLDGVSVGGIDDIFQRDSVCVCFPSDFGGEV